MKKITTRSREGIEYTHYFRKTKSAKKDTKLVLRLHADPDGIIPWLEPDPETGRMTGPTGETADKFLALVIDDADAAKLAEAIEKRWLSPAERYGLAVMAFRNSTGAADFQNIWAKIESLTDIANTFEAAALAAAAKKAANPAEDDATPLED